MIKIDHMTQSAEGAELSRAPDPDLGRAPAQPSEETVTIVTVAGWIFGLFLLGGIVIFVLHLTDFQLFMATIRAANPIWLAAAVVCQISTYFCASLIWWCILRHSGAPLKILALLRLALVELFANQALPTGGLSGSIMVVRGLSRRGVAASTATTALLVTALSYYSAYLIVGMLAFVLLWYMGDFSSAWVSMSVIFVVIIIVLAVAVVMITRSHGRFIPGFAHAWKPVARLANVFANVKTDILHDISLMFEVLALQSAIFLLDAATLWCAAMAVGMNLGLAQIFVSSVLSSIVATLSPVPMGLGTFEATCTGMLHFFGGSVEQSLAATLIFRALTLWLPMLPGVWLIRRETKAHLANQ